jgi:hypothetical protein
MGKLSGEDEDQQEQTGDEAAPYVADPGDDTDPEQQVDKQDDSVPTVIEASDDEPQGDKRIATDEDDDGETSEEGEEPRRKRETAKERRDRAKAARARDKQDIDLLRATTQKQDQALLALSRQLIVMQVTDLDSRLATETNTANQMDEIFAAAITQKNGKDAAAAAKLRDEAKQNAWNLYHQKEALVKQLNQPVRQEVPYKNQAMAFVADKPWYNPASGDEDSLIVEAMDKALAKTMNPNDPAYWATLDKKVRARLPHKFNDTSQDDDGAEDDQDEPAPRAQQRQAAAPRRKGPPTGGSSRSQGSGNRGDIHIPAAMVAAMKEAGHWDDPKVRARVAKRYIDGIKNNSNG